MRARRAIGAALLVMGVSLLGYALWLLLGSFATEGSYRLAAAEHVRPTVRETSIASDAGAEEADSVEVDWDALGPDAAAWLTVSSTPIDYPVCQASDEDPEWYLHRDCWGAWNDIGCPYIDHRTTADAPHTLVYAHHLTYTDWMFTAISDWHDPDVLASHESDLMLWTTKGMGTRRLVPVCALVADRWEQLIQRFRFENPSELRSWLSEVVEASDARTALAEQAVLRARKVVTLATCRSSWLSEQRRVLVVFACI